jgi:uncharacterized RDD family membrane protein YckC
MTVPELPGNGDEGPEPLPSAVSPSAAWAPPWPPGPVGVPAGLRPGAYPGLPPGASPGLPPGVVPDQPPGVAPPRNPLGRRASAALVDVVVLSVVFLILGLATGGTPVPLPPGELSWSVGTVAVSTWSIRFGEVTVAGGWLALYLALVLVYYFALEATTGRTVGKRILGLRVVSRDGSRPSQGAIAVRTLLRLVDWVPLLYLVGFITALATGRRRQRVGDLAAQTEVAVVPGASVERWQPVLAGILAGLALLGLSVRVVSGGATGQASAIKPCHGVSFDHPPGWLEAPASVHGTSHPMCRTALFLGPSDAIVVEAYPEPGRVTAANLAVVTPLVTGGVRRVVAQGGGVLLAGPQRTTVGGLPALEYRVSGRSYYGVPATTTLVFAFAGTTQYEIGCQQTRAHAAQVTRACGQALRTFTVAGYPAPPTPAAAPAGSPQRWVQGLGSLRWQMDNALPPGNITPGSLRASAAKLRRCTPELAALGPPPARLLRPTYRLAKRACAAFDQAAGYATAAARAYTTTSPSSRAGRKLSKLLNQTDAAVNHGTGLIDNAYYGAPVLPPGYTG